MKLEKFCEGIQDKVDVFMGVTRTMIEDIQAFNKDYVDGLKRRRILMAKCLQKLRIRFPVFKSDYQNLIFHHQIGYLKNKFT